MATTMEITVSLHGVFRINRFKEKSCRYPEGCTAQCIIDDLDIPASLLGIVMINGKHSTAEDQLHDGDRLMLLPLLEGG